MRPLREEGLPIHGCGNPTAEGLLTKNETLKDNKGVGLVTVGRHGGTGEVAALVLLSTNLETLLHEVSVKKP